MRPIYLQLMSPHPPPPPSTRNQKEEESLKVNWFEYLSNIPNGRLLLSSWSFPLTTCAM